MLLLEQFYFQFDFFFVCFPHVTVYKFHSHKKGFYRMSSNDNRPPLPKRKITIMYNVLGAPVSSKKECKNCIGYYPTYCNTCECKQYAEKYHKPKKHKQHSNITNSIIEFLSVFFL